MSKSAVLLGLYFLACTSVYGNGMDRMEYASKGMTLDDGDGSTTGADPAPAQREIDLLLRLLNCLLDRTPDLEAATYVGIDHLRDASDLKKRIKIGKRPKKGKKPKRTKKPKIPQHTSEVSLPDLNVDITADIIIPSSSADSDVTAEEDTQTDAQLKKK